jgi:Zn-dependent peptidase ImmA (M78 family)
MNQTNYNTDGRRSVLAVLRSLVPARRVRFSEALRIAELQASRLLELVAVEDCPVPDEVVTELPRIVIEYRDIPTSGVSFWDGQGWIICLNRTEPRTRQRFTLFHEYKHIIDHGRTGQLYADGRQAEQVADYFAGCVLMSRLMLKRAWGAGVQRPAAVAERFEVSERAATVRLAQVGLNERAERCQLRSNQLWPARRGHYFRTSSTVCSPIAKELGYVRP